MSGQKIEGRAAFVGAGNMSGALVRGLLSSGAIEADRIWCTDVRSEALEALQSSLGVRVGRDNREAAAWADVIVLATKPSVFERVLPEVGAGLRADALVISIAAGVSLASIEAALPSRAVIRAMPNTPALVGAGATALCRGAHATQDHLEQAARIFGCVGITVVVEEALMDAVTGLSGSGPGYVFVAIEALADGGVRAGLPREIALRLAAQTVLGAAKMVLESGKHPGALKDSVASPGGTTIAGLHALETRGLRGALISAVTEASERSREIGARERGRNG